MEVDEGGRQGETWIMERMEGRREKGREENERERKRDKQRK